jgi:hypothetical protein
MANHFHHFCFISILFFGALHAQPVAIKSPDEFLSYKLGSRFTRHHLLVDYFRYMDGVSDKMQLIQYGQTNELRPLIAAIITSAANLKRIESIRQNNLRRTGMLAGDVVDENIAFVYLSYSVHGNEAAGSESSMAVLYDLIKAGAPYDAWLENTVVIIDPCLNPDGYNRYSQWSNSVSASVNNPNPDSREHTEPWPGGRLNHYYHDLNRDWAWQSQVESRNRIAFYLKWMPQVHADIHEMSSESSYYFAPAAQPYHPVVTPWQASFQREIGKNHASHFDKEGWRYYTRERFDLFYPSYGDTYPTFSGAIGMTYEQAGGGYADRAVILSSGDTLTLYDRIAHHRASSLSTIEVSSKNASKLVCEFQLYFKNSIADPPGDVNSYVIKKSNHPGRVADFLSLLDRQGIIYGEVQHEKNELKGFSYFSGDQKSFTIQTGDIIVPASQPRAVMTQVLFEPEAKLTDSITYDITAWSIPMAYGLDIYGTNEVLAYIPHQESIKNIMPVDAKPYAYAMQWGSVPSTKALATLLQKGVIARTAPKAFSFKDVTYPEGTVLLMRADNKNNPQFDQTVRNIANESVVPFSLIHSGMVESGKDLGSDDYQKIRKPEVLVFSGKGMSPHNLGEVWHFFEAELDYPVTIADLDQAESVNLDQYNVLLLTEGNYSLKDDLLHKIDDWVNDGGRLIVIGSGITKVAGREGFGIKRKTMEELDSLNKIEEAHPPIYSSGERKSLSSEVPGAIFQTTLDASHPLTFGMGGVYWTLKTNTNTYSWLDDSANAIYLDDTPHYYGFAGYKALADIKKTLVAGQENLGGGSVVYLVDNPLFRSFWNSGKVLFSNALFF